MVNLGDVSLAPPGTYFRSKGEDVNYFWHMFDQVLVRRGLLGSLANDGVSIVTRIGNVDLLTKLGRPNSVVASDHLPIVCKLGKIQEAPNVIEEFVG